MNDLMQVTLNFGEVQLSCPIENGHRMIPVRTVCKIINVAFPAQDSWLKKHQYFSQLYNPRVTVGADSKERMMNCLSIFDIDGWIHSIGAKGRKAGSIEKQYAFLAWLREQKMELYKSIEEVRQENEYEYSLLDKQIALLEKKAELDKKKKDLEKELNQVKKSLEETRMNRFKGQTGLPFPSEN